MGLGGGKGRSPDPKSKVPQIIIRAKQGQVQEEIEVKAFKEICSRNGLNMREEIFTRAIRPFLKDHNWPPGNSQTLMEVYTEPKKKLVCAHCKKEAPKLYEALFISGAKLKFCEGCYQDAKRNKLVKKFIKAIV